jgi:hypothetical protein
MNTLIRYLPLSLGNRQPVVNDNYLGATSVLLPLPVSFCTGNPTRNNKRSAFNNYDLIFTRTKRAFQDTNTAGQ